MRMTRGVVGNLINRYRAVLKKCHILNVFGTLAVGALLCGGVGVAQAAISEENASLTVGSGTIETLDAGKTYKVTDASRTSVNIGGGTLVMQAGSALALNVGGGVIVQNNGTLEMKGAKITGATYTEGAWVSGPTMTLGGGDASAGNLLISSGVNNIEVQFDLQKGSLTVNEGTYLGLLQGGEDDNNGAPAIFGAAGGADGDATVTIAGLMGSNALTINSGTVNITSKGRLETDAVDMKGGVVTTDALYVAGDGTSHTQPDKAGFVVDTAFTVGGGTVNTKYLDVQTYVSNPALDGATLTINKGEVNVNGDVLVKSASGGSQAEIAITDGGHLNITGKLDVSQGRVTVDGNKGSIYFKNDTTLDVTTISSDKSKTSGIILLNENTKGNGQIFVQQHRLTLVGGDKLAAATGNVKADYLTIGTDNGKMDVVGGELKVYGKQSATDANAVLIANTLSTSAGGSIQLGDDDTGTFGGSTTANFKIAGAGRLSVYEDWTVGDVSLAGGSLRVGKGSLTANKLDMTGAGNSVVLTDNGYLRLDSEKSLVGFFGGGGTIEVGGQPGGVNLENSALYFTNGATLKASDIVSIAAAGKIALIDEHGMLKTGIDKKLTLADASAQTLNIGQGSIKTYNLDVKTGDANGALTIASGRVSVLGNRADTNGGLNATKVTLDAGVADKDTAVLSFGEASGPGKSDGLMGGKINADITATKGEVHVNGGQWIMVEGKTLEVTSAGSLNVATQAGLDVKGTLKITGSSQPAQPAMVNIAGGGTLTAADMQVSAVTNSGGAVEVAGGGNLSVNKLHIDGAKDVHSIAVNALGSVTGTTAGNFLTQAANGDFTVNTGVGGAGLEGGFSGKGFMLLDGTATYTQEQLKAASAKLGITVGYTNGTFKGKVEIGAGESIVAQKNEVTLTGTGALTGTVVAQTVKANGAATSVAVGTGSLTVLGTGGTGSVITNANGAAVNTITVADKGSLGLGNAAIAGAQGGSVGVITMNGDAQVQVQKGVFAATDVDMAGSGGRLTVNGGGTLSADTLTAQANNTITVGTPASAGTLVAKNVTMAGAALYMDPSWATGGVHPGTYGSRAALTFTANKVDGLLTVGNASQLTLGTTNVQWLSDTLGKSGQWGTGITAALGIYSQQQLDATNGGILVDAGATGPSADKNVAEFASKSLLAIHAPAGLQASGGALMAATATDTLTVAADAKLLIVGGNDKDVVKVVSGFGNGASSIDASSWAAGNLLTDTSMMQATVDNAYKTATDYRVTLNRTGSAASAFPLLSEGGATLVNALFDQNRRDVNSPDAGIRFLSRAVGDQGGVYVKDATDTARVIEGAARLGASAGVSQATLGAVSAATTAVMNRTSQANPLSGTKTTAMVNDPETNSWNTESGLNAGDSNKAGSTALWIMPLYQSNNSWGMKAGNFKTGLTSDLFGVALGADYGISDEFRIGAAFNIGGGHAQSKGDFYKTTNDFNFWGVSVYGGYAANNLALMADVGYTGMYNKAKQELPSSMAMGEMKSDIESSALTAGLRGEYKISTDVMDFTPYVGVRYTGVTTQDYKAKADGGTVFKNSTDQQNVWTFPVGVTLSKDIVTSTGWTVKPQLDLGIIAAAGDLEVRNSAKVAGLATSADMKTQVVDGITFDGGLGLNVGKDNVSFGVTYNLQTSEHRVGHGVNAIFRYEF